MVEHHLAKVRVAGSNPVVRSEWVLCELICGGLAERRGNGLQIRVHGFKSRTHLEKQQHHNSTRAIGAVVARFPDTEEVTGSNPVSPTQEKPLDSNEFGGFTFHQTALVGVKWG